MKAINKLLLGVAALSLCACSNDEPAPNGNGPAAGDVAYLNVRIMSADAAASRATDGGHEDADDNADEGKINNAYFFFYDEAGRYVLQSNSWTKASDPDDTNIETMGEGTVILTGLTGKNYPTWVVTVLNYDPQTMHYGQTLQEMKEIVVDNYKAGNGFIMTTSSYVDNTQDAANGDPTYYYATRLQEKNFLQETPDKEEAKAENTVDIYVERLAVRAQVTTNLSNKPTKVGDRTLYKLDVSVAGETNPDTGESNNLAATAVYVELLGWDLYATANKSNLIKNIDGWTTAGDALNALEASTVATWKSEALTNGSTFTWNNPEKHRSYWGKSWVYGKKGDELKDMLNVESKYWNQMAGSIMGETVEGKSNHLYCNENTNEIENITNTDCFYALSNKTTSIILAARVCNEKGEALDIVNYLGVNYLKGSFLNMVLAKTNPAFYTRKDVGNQDGNPIYEYTQISANELELAEADGTGSVKAVVKKDAEIYTISKPGSSYSYDVKDENGTVIKTVTITTYDGSHVTDFTDVNNKLAEATTGESNKAIAYTHGAMYYPIPLEHLRHMNKKATSTNKLVEGTYGVVRNHIYNLNITKLISLGEGVFKPGKFGEFSDETEPDPEPINPDDPKDPTFYVESAVNVLSYKIVNQDVEI